MTDEVTGFIQITTNPDDVRPVGHTIISGVDIGNGNLGLSYTDVEIPNRGLSLSFTRSYNTLAANVFSPFGSGWHHNYQILLVHNLNEQERPPIHATTRALTTPETDLRHQPMLSVARFDMATTPPTTSPRLLTPPIARPATATTP